MQAISSTFLSQIPSHLLQKKHFQTSIGHPDLHQTISNTFSHIPDSETMAIAAFTLGDLPSDKVRREVVADLWDSGAEVIIVIDRGTPRGFDMVANAREQLLRLDRHTRPAVDGVLVEEEDGIKTIMEEDGEVHKDEIEIDGVTFVAEGSESAKAAMAENTGCFIVAPVSCSVRCSREQRVAKFSSVQCPHDGVCPLHKTRNFCHFAQKGGLLISCSG
jgi:ribosomal protein RSM22 (predicted rRNA methylase)